MHPIHIKHVSVDKYILELYERSGFTQKNLFRGFRLSSNTNQSNQARPGGRITKRLIKNKIIDWNKARVAQEKKAS